MGNLQQDLDAIAAKQGKSIPPGNYIAGEGSWPEAALPMNRPQSEPFEPDDHAFDQPETLARVPSPMIPREVIDMRSGSERHIAEVKEAVGLRPVEAPPDFPIPDLTIFGGDATTYIAAYQGRQVELTKPESAAVRKVVLQAIKRGIMEQLGEVEALLPKRKRHKKGPRMDLGRIPDSGDMPFVQPRKRGRPRKVQP